MAKIPRAPSSELFGSNDAQVTLGPEPVQSTVTLAQAPLKTYAASFTKAAVSPDAAGEPDRLFLKLRNIRGNQGACAFCVTVSVPGVAGPPVDVASLSLFGIEGASDPKGPHGGAGLTKTIEVTEALDRYAPELKKAGKVLVGLSPLGRMRATDKITIEAIGLYRLPER
jgi:tyrosinase